MIEVGAQAPDFTLASHLGGKEYSLSQFKGEKMYCWPSIHWIGQAREARKCRISNHDSVISKRRTLKFWVLV